MAADTEIMKIALVLCMVPVLVFVGEPEFVANHNDIPHFSSQRIKDNLVSVFRCPINLGFLSLIVAWRYVIFDVIVMSFLVNVTGAMLENAVDRYKWSTNLIYWRHFWCFISLATCTLNVHKTQESISGRQPLQLRAYIKFPLHVTNSRSDSTKGTQGKDLNLWQQKHKDTKRKMPLFVV